MSDSILLRAESIEFAYNGHPVLQDANLALRTGDLVALLGPNGSGKTTMLKLLCGLLSPQGGQVLWNGSNLAGGARRDIARQIALVPQELNVPFSFTVSEIVGLGRTPHLRPLMGESARDRAAVNSALELTGTLDLRRRFFGELSGGERQRVVIAMALAQIGESEESHPVLLLDEPTVHLDINHQVEVLELIGRLNRERGLTVLATMHDLNLAALYFDRLILLNQGRILTEGSPSEVLSQERVESVFHTNVMIQSHPTRADAPHVILLPSQRNRGR